MLRCFHIQYAIASTTSAIVSPSISYPSRAIEELVRAAMGWISEHRSSSDILEKIAEIDGDDTNLARELRHMISTVASTLLNDSGVYMIRAYIGLRERKTYLIGHALSVLVPGPLSFRPHHPWDESTYSHMDILS